jgi:hypothetical protein
MEFFILYSKVKILVIWNNHEYDVKMNGIVMFVETYDKNSEHMHVKWKYVVTIVWNILQEFKSHFYHLSSEVLDLMVLEGGEVTYPAINLN